MFSTFSMAIHSSFDNCDKDNTHKMAYSAHPKHWEMKYFSSWLCFSWHANCVNVELLHDINDITISFSNIYVDTHQCCNKTRFTKYKDVNVSSEFFQGLYVSLFNTCWYSKFDLEKSWYLCHVYHPQSQYSWTVMFLQFSLTCLTIQGVRRVLSSILVQTTITSTKRPSQVLAG